jgi:hypothetical protein
MEIEPRSTVELKITLNDQDLQRLETDPTSIVAQILGRWREAREALSWEPSPRKLPVADMDGREPCPYPNCVEMIKPRGLGVHFNKTHGVSHQKWLTRKEQESKKATHK